MQWGENIAMGGGSIATAEEAAATAATLARYWYTREVCDMNWVTHDASAALHFSQVVWKSTRHVGCALVSSVQCPNGITSPFYSGPRHTSMLVCMYDPAGNFYGGFVNNVDRGVADLDSCN